MRRLFNTGGPCDPLRNYMLPPLRRLPGVRRWIDDGLYFVLHAQRQSGKTTALLALAEELTREGRYTSLLVSMEIGQPFSDDLSSMEDALLGSWEDKAEVYLPPELRPPAWPAAGGGQRINRALKTWAVASKRPLVLFLDEIDSLRDSGLISVLRQIRDGYAARPAGFPWSLALIGLRDVRDYKVASGSSDRLGTSSPFNIKAESLTLANFTAADISELYAQHTADTGQVFAPEAVERAYYWTQGQPWLVNALARQLVEQLFPDPAHAITAGDVDVAKEVLIQRQDTHLDSLAEWLKEDRVRRIIEPLLAGRVLGEVPDDDLRFVVDLGLLRLGEGRRLELANPIYREVLPRVLANGPAASLPRLTPGWLRSDGRLDTDRLLESFLAFWRQHAELLFASAPYHEIAPHLVMMAFLHRVANGVGTIEREYAIGTGRMDLCLRYGDATLAIELKVWRDGYSDPSTEGLGQLDDYLGGLGLSSGWLVIFDRRNGQPTVAERTSSEPARTPGGRDVLLIRA